jgi:hypothetical protein
LDGGGLVCLARAGKAIRRSSKGREKGARPKDEDLACTSVATDFLRRDRQAIVSRR